MTGEVLVVDDDRPVREALTQTLELAEYRVRAVGSFIEAKDHIAPDFSGVVLSDIRMPGRDGFHLLSYTRALDDELPVILLTGEGDIPMAVKAMGEGAFDFLEKPCAPDQLIPVLERAMKNRRLVLENRRLKAQLETGDPAARMLFGTSQLAEDMRQTVRQAARAGTEVLVTGPPGAGVSKVAEVIHLMSQGAGGPFVKRAAAGLDPQALEAAYAQAAGGNLFLDEIMALPTASQYALLERLDPGARRGSLRAAPPISGRPPPRVASTPISSTGWRCCACASRRSRNGPRISPSSFATTSHRRPSRPGSHPPRSAPITSRH
jgi:two-component system C4-dicarboxylate transport response regulator DctD